MEKVQSTLLVKSIGKEGQQKIKKGQSHIYETNAERSLSLDELRRECLNFAQRNFQGRTFTNRDIGRTIQVSHQE